MLSQTQKQCNRVTLHTIAVGPGESTNVEAAPPQMYAVSIQLSLGITMAGCPWAVAGLWTRVYPLWPMS